MENAKNLVPIFCSEHKNQSLSLVNPDASAPKHVYCFECLMQTEDPKSLFKSFPKIDDFVNHAADTFAKHKSQIKSVQEVPIEFLDVVSRQAESLEQLSKHINEEKKKIEAFFEQITDVVVDAIDKLKNEHLEMLDKQVANFQENYSQFEKMMKRMYPKKEDIENMFPTKDDLDTKLEKIKTAIDLERLIKELKQDLGVEREEISIFYQSDELKQNFLRQLDSRLKETERNKPSFDQVYQEKNTKEELKKQLNQLFGLNNLKNPIGTDIFLLENLSSIISPNDFLTLRGWIPANIEFTPRLLFRMTRDGKDSQKFNSQIHKKGPTITLIRCKYDGASQESIIGGFIDKDIDQKYSAWISSDQAFVFSLTQKIKCPIILTANAISIGPSNQVWFGHNATIGVYNSFTKCTSQINSDKKLYTYENSEKIIPPESFKGLNEVHKFTLEDLEVFAVN